MKVDTNVKAGAFQLNLGNLGQVSSAQLSGIGAAVATNVAVLAQSNINVAPSIHVTVG